MGRLTLRLPDTLHHDLENLARAEGVSLNQYIVFALTRQATQAFAVQAVPEQDLARQQTAFAALLETLGPAAFDAVSGAVSENSQGKPDSGLDAEGQARLRRRLQHIPPPE